MNHMLLGLPKQHAPGAAWFTCSLGFLNYIVGLQGCSACAEILVNCRGSEDKIQDKRHYYSVDSLLQKWKTLKCEWARIKIYTKHCHSQRNYWHLKNILTALSTHRRALSHFVIPGLTSIIAVKCFQACIISPDTCIAYARLTRAGKYMGSRCSTRW